MNKFLPALECNQSSEWQQFPAAGPWLLKHISSVIQCWAAVPGLHPFHTAQKTQSNGKVHDPCAACSRKKTALKGDENSRIISVPTSISQLVGQPETKNLSGSLLSQNIWYNQWEHKTRFFSQNLQINCCVAFTRTCWESHNNLAGFLFKKV